MAESVVTALTCHGERREEEYGRVSGNSSYMSTSTCTVLQ